MTVNPTATEPSVPRIVPAPRARARKALWIGAATVLLALLGCAGVAIGHRLATVAVIDIGPTDARYVRGFRDIEREGKTFFRWTVVPSSSLSLPLRACGSGSIRLRVRRHFSDPALLQIGVGGTVVGVESIEANEEEPYRVIEFPFTSDSCSRDIQVTLESKVSNDRPLGVTIDWVEMRSAAGFRASPGSLSRGAAAPALAGLAILLAGGGIGVCAGVGGVVSLLVALGFATDPLVGERILRGGFPALFLTLLVGALIWRLSLLRGLSGRSRVLLVGITLVTVISRLAFLHPQAFYPDYRVHGLVLQTLNGMGLSRFMDQLFEIQYARSLGLQEVAGNWYPFPYPPGSYFIAGTIGRIFGLDPLDASMVMGAAAASLIPAVTVAIGLTLGLSEGTSVAGAFFVALQPLLLRRMALGYFPGLAGQFVDAAVLLGVFQSIRRADSSWVRLSLLALGFLGSFLVYTQAIANFGLLIGGLLLVEAVRRSSGLLGSLRVAMVATLALFASIGLFYSKYLPVIENARTGTPQPEARVLDRLDDIRRANLSGAPEDEMADDPFQGPTLNPARGFARLGSRLWRFNGFFAVAMLGGFWLLWRGRDRSDQNLVAAWGGVAVWISLLASGLPSPNGFQHLKDLEFVTPLLALSLGVLASRLWTWQPFVAASFAGLWVFFAVRAFAVELAERLVPLVGR